MGEIIGSWSEACSEAAELHQPRTTAETCGVYDIGKCGAHKAVRLLVSKEMASDTLMMTEDCLLSLQDLC